MKSLSERYCRQAQGQIPSRQAATKAGLPWSVKTETINKVCASGMRSVTLGDQLIRLGDEEVIVAGGMESMSNAPYYLPKGRFGLKMGDTQLVDGMIYDGLSCSFSPDRVHMGTYGNSTAEELSLTREAQDEWSLRSHERALHAIDNGLFAEEIIAVEIPQRKGDPRNSRYRRSATSRYITWNHWQNYVRHSAKTARLQLEMHQASMTEHVHLS